MLTRALALPVLLFFGLCWGTFLAGIILMQLHCAADSGDGSNGTMGLGGAWGWSAFMPCHRIFRFYWFIIAFSLLALLGALIASGPRHGLRASRPFWVGMFSIVALLFMIASEAMLAAWDSAALVDSIGLRVAIAGAISSTAAAIFTMLHIGTDWGFRRTVGGGGAPPVASRRAGSGDKVPTPRYGLGEALPSGAGAAAPAGAVRY